MRTLRSHWALGGVGICLGVFACSDGGQALDDDIGVHGDGVIIGPTNDLIKVTANGANLAAKYQPLVHAVGKLSMGCTATHVGKGIAISAAHCWSSAATATRKAWNCSGASIAWGNIGSTNTNKSTSQCVEGLAIQKVESGTQVDYAIFRVSPVPPDFIEPDLTAKATNGTTLTIFSHPNGRPLEWSQTCALKNSTTSQLRYDCDTEPGSSGASVLSDGSLKIVAIHWGGAASGNIATHLLSTPLGEYMGQQDGGGTGGAGGADGGGDGSAGKGGSDGGDASPGDGTSDAPRDGTTDGTTDGADGSGGSAGASGAGGTAGAGGAGAGGTAGTGGSAGKAGASGAGGSGTAGAGGKGGSSGAGGATGGAAGTGTGGAAGSGTGGAAAGTGGVAGSGGSAGGSAGKGGTGGSTSTGTAGTGGTSSDDSGCSCRIAATPSSNGRFAGLLALGALGMVGSLRRARRKSKVDAG